MNLLRIAGIFGGLIALLLFVEKGRLIQPSTRTALKLAYQKYGLKFFLDGRGPNIFAYGRWINQYIAMYQRLLRWGGPKTKNWMAETYHGKILTTELAKDIITMDEDIPWRDLSTKIIPYRTAREFMLSANSDIAVMECACRANSSHGCKPSQVCMAIGHPFTDFILEHRPNETRRITQEEAVAIIEDANRRGWVHHAYFKDATYNRFYALCNCCPECCTGIMAKQMGVNMICASGYQCTVIMNNCKGCGECAKICPFHAVSIFDGHSMVDHGKCMGCGACIPRCVNSARQLKEGGELEPLNVRAMKSDKGIAHA